MADLAHLARTWITWHTWLVADFHSRLPKLEEKGIVSIFGVLARMCGAVALVDSVTPIIKEGEDIAHGGPVNLRAWTFFLPTGGSRLSAKEVEKLLKREHIQYWSSTISWGLHSFSVKRADAKRVEMLLDEREIAVDWRSRGG